MHRLARSLLVLALFVVGIYHQLLLPAQASPSSPFSLPVCSDKAIVIQGNQTPVPNAPGCVMMHTSISHGEGFIDGASTVKAASPNVANDGYIRNRLDCGTSHCSGGNITRSEFRMTAKVPSLTVGKDPANYAYAEMVTVGGSPQSTWNCAGSLTYNQTSLGLGYFHIGDQIFTDDHLHIFAQYADVLSGCEVDNYSNFTVLPNSILQGEIFATTVSGTITAWSARVWAVDHWAYILLNKTAYTNVTGDSLTAQLYTYAVNGDVSAVTVPYSIIDHVDLGWTLNTSPYTEKVYAWSDNSSPISTRNLTTWQTKSPYIRWQPITFYNSSCCPNGGT